MCFPSDAEYLVQTKPLFLKFLLQRKHDRARILAGRSRGRDEVEDAARRANAHEFIVKMPEGYFVEFGGAYKNLE